MNPADLPLRDIHLPDPIGWWPPAPIWWIAAVVVLLLCAVALRVYLRRKAWRRSAVFVAQNELARLREAWLAHGDAQRLASELSTWLRRVVISVRSRGEAASLTGKQWWRYLDQLAGQGVFGPDGGKLITEAPYRPAAEIDGERLMTLCERWIRLLADKELDAEADDVEPIGESVWQRRVA